MPYSILVSDQASLMAALANAKGGETIYLQGGEYGSVRLDHGKNGDFRFDETVRLVSADPGEPAVITGLSVQGASNVTFEGLVFDYRFAGQQTLATPFSVGGSDNLTFTKSLFTGDVASDTGTASDGFPTGRGLTISGSSAITVSDNEIEGFAYGISAGRSQDIAITGNNIHSIRADGMSLGQLQGVLIENNHIHNFKRNMAAGDHADMIQFQQGPNAENPSADIVIRGNYFDSGAGHYVQTIFMGNTIVSRGLAGEEMYYRNILIEDNVVINTQVNGIFVGHADGVIIRNNSVLRIETPLDGVVGEAVTIPRIRVVPEATNVEIVQNVVFGITGHDNQPDWTVGDNLYIQYSNPVGGGWYRDMFVTSSLQLDGIHHNYIVRPGGAMDVEGIGASALRRPVSEAAFNYESAVPNGPEMVFDAAVFADQHLPGTQYQWSFGDGSTATGPLVSHLYAYAGHYDVTLTVISPVDGPSIARSTVGVRASDHLRLGADGQLVRNEFGVLTEFEIANAHEDGHLVLGGPGISGRIARALVRPLMDEEQIALDFSLRAGDPGNTGEIFRIHGNMIGAVNKAGEVTILAWTEGGQSVRVTSKGLRVNDGEDHAVTMQLSNGKLSLWVNDTLVDQTDFSGTIRSNGRHDLIFGNAWHSESSFFVGELSDFAIRHPNGAATRPLQSDIDDTLLPHPDDTTHPDLPEPEPVEIVDPRLVLATHDTVQLGGPGITSLVDRSELTELFKQQDIGISFTLDADASGARGEVFRLHGSMWVSVDRAGELVVQAKSTEGQNIWLKSQGTRVNDGEEHAIDIQLSGGKLSLWVNDVKLAEDDFGGSFVQSGRRDLTFGNPWHGQDRFFNGELSEFRIDMADPFTALAAAQMDFASMPLI